MINKDFIKQVLREEKELMPLSQVKQVSVPHYDELSVKKFLPMLSEDEEFKKYMPEPGNDSRLPDRTFFWNIAHTLHPSYVTNVISHANDQRMKGNEKNEEMECIQISEKWWDQLNAVPFVSCKCRLLPIIHLLTNLVCAEHKGKTLHLLK